MLSVFVHRYLPLKIYLYFALFTVLCLFISPIKFSGIRYFVVLPYLALILAFFSAGYHLGVKGSAVDVYKGPSGADSRYFRWIVSAATVLALVSWVGLVSSGNTISISAIGSNYVEAYADYVRGEASIDALYILRIFGSSITTIALLYIFTYFGSLSGRTKYLSYFVVFSYLFVNVIGAGKQKYLGDILIFSLYSGIVWVSAKNITASVKNKLYFVLFAFTGLLVFSYILSLRYSAIDINIDNINASIHPLTYWDNSSLLTVILGDKWSFGPSLFLNYITNGIYGLDICMSLPFEWTYFVGNSYSVGRLLEILLGIDLSLMHI